MQSVFARSTCASKYAEEEYKKRTEIQNVYINVKKEHTEKYSQLLGSRIIISITYGYGDMKVKGCKKSGISYIVLLDENCKPIWSEIICE